MCRMISNSKKRYRQQDLHSAGIQTTTGKSTTWQPVMENKTTPVWSAIIKIVSENVTIKKKTTLKVLYVDLSQVLTQISAVATVESADGTVAIRSTGYKIIGYESIYLSDGSVGYICKEDIETVKTPILDA